MSNSTQNDDIGKMERAINEGFAESEKFLKGMKTPFDKSSTQNNHETHTACIERIKKEGASATCCHCNPHDGCTLEMKPTQNDWEVRFNDRFLNNWGTLLDIKHFIRKELADARREVIQRVMSVLPLGDDPRYRELKDVLAALKEEIL